MLETKLHSLVHWWFTTKSTSICYYDCLTFIHRYWVRSECLLLVSIQPWSLAMMLRALIIYSRTIQHTSYSFKVRNKVHNYQIADIEWISLSTKISDLEDTFIGSSFILWKFCYFCLRFWTWEGGHTAKHSQERWAK